MSRTVARAGGPNWLAAIAGAMVLAVALAWFTTPQTVSQHPRPALPPAAQALPNGSGPATPVAAQASLATTVPRPGYNMDAGQKISIDPATGQARPIEHDDAQLPSVARSSTADPEQVPHPSGAVSVTIPETADVYTVATKSPGGAISIAHVEGLRAAQLKTRQAGTARRAPAKEVLNDR